MGFVRRRARRRTALVVGGAAYAAGAARRGQQNQPAQEEVPPAPPPPAESSVSAEPSLSSEGIDEIQRLADLNASGALTDEEFAEAKAKILGS